MDKYIKVVSIVVRIILICMIGLTTHAQTAAKWFAFYDSSYQLMGYKDETGIIRVPLRFDAESTPAKRVEKVAYVLEWKGEKFFRYHINTDGKTFGRDSAYIFDNTPDCESEGFIRFMDKQSGMIGLFNAAGKVVIPARYIALSPVHNGTLVALSGARKVLWKPHEDDHHFSWEGGNETLIDTNGLLLIPHFLPNYPLDLYSRQETDQPSEDSLRLSFRNVRGRYYSFLDKDKQFLHWFTTQFCRLITTSSAVDSLLFREIICEHPDTDRLILAPRQFMLNGEQFVNTTLNKIKDGTATFSVFDECLSAYEHSVPWEDFYFNGCGQQQRMKYPVKSVVVSYKAGKDRFLQDRMDFLFTPQGYRLIAVAIRTQTLKHWNK